MVIEKNHVVTGRWILVPLDDLKIPKPGRLCVGPRWWALTEDGCVMFFDTYGSPQCNQERSIVLRLGQSFGAPKTTDPVYVDMAFVPHRCSDYC